jgi:FkbM family methyltransferase
MSAISWFQRLTVAPAQSPPTMENAVLWSYRLLLGREPESVDVIQRHARGHHSVNEIRRTFMQSDEFGQRAAEAGARVPDAEVLKHFPAWTGPGEPGFWRDFLGVRTRCDYLPDAYAALSGAVEGPPGTERAGIHEVAEWIGTLRSVLEARARGTLVVVELGAGWGPWLVGAAKAAEHVGIPEIHLTGVEGERGHLAFMQQHFRDNSLDPDAHRLIHGVVGVRDGVAGFPKAADPRNDYGSVADYSAAAAGAEGFEYVPCIALTTLLGQLPPVDLIHCDVQGAEHDVLISAQSALEARVRRVVVGTHARRIEVDLLDFFAALGWKLEDEGVCRQLQTTDGFRLVQDGYQVWVNPRRDLLQ